MRLLNNNFITWFFLILFFLSQFNVHANDDLERTQLSPYCHNKFIHEFFDNNPKSLFFLGLRHFYLGSMFSSVLKDGVIEDNYTYLLFIIPFGGKEGIVIQFDDKVVDAFIFVFDPVGFELSPRIEDRFYLKDTRWSKARLSHRDTVLQELGRMRFQLCELAVVNSYLKMVDIKIE